MMSLLSIQMCIFKDSKSAQISVLSTFSRKTSEKLPKDALFKVAQSGGGGRGQLQTQGHGEQGPAPPQEEPQVHKGVDKSNAKHECAICWCSG